MKNLGISLLYLLISISTYGQTLTQTIRGVIADKTTKTPLPGVSIIIPGTTPLIGTTTDINGAFRIEKVSIGKVTLQVNYLGYETLTLNNLVVNSGKELVVQIDLEEKIIQGKEIEIIGNLDKEKPMNEMAMVSARTFSVEETQKFAAAVNDPARMASSFAGVVSADDGNNNITIRGNAPNTLQWRMEGVEIPNPNHFSSAGSSGGGVSILSSQLLYNSDFLTGAFSSEYGNALSGVFDLRLRKGNNEKKEFTVQAGFLGLDLAAEGPFSKNYQGSYLINYRYSTLSIIQKLLNLGDAVTLFQDLSFNVYLPTKKVGSFSVFGFGGLSSQNYEAKTDSTEWETDEQRYGSEFGSNTSAVGVSHSLTINPKTYIKTILILSKQKNNDKTLWLNDELENETRYDSYTEQINTRLSSVVNHKFNSKLNLRSGFILSKLNYQLKTKDYNNETSKLEETAFAKGGDYTLQLHSGLNYRISNKWTAQGGIHYLQFFYNNTNSIEGRGSIRYAINERQNISFGYGLHSQLQPISVYFVTTQENNNAYFPNKDLGLSKSRHYVLSYDRMLNAFIHLKSEVYYQQLFNIPIMNDPTKTFSMVNESDGYITDALVNKGKGKNYGLEITLEQFMRNDMYFLLSSSFYNSSYQCLDNIWRDTKYNGGFASSFTGGKEIKVGNPSKNKVIGLNVKLIYTGGLRYTPIDTAASMLAGETIYQENLAYSKKNHNYFRTDIRISLKRNRENTTHTLALDIQNVTNNKNIFGEYYDVQTASVKTFYQTPLIPILSYKLDF